MSFMDENFLLEGKTARRLYHNYAEKLPIIDYHCHLSPAEIASDRRFKTITEAWLGGDHYKWRLMRIFGIDEKLITGDGDDYEKFYAYARTLETAIGNPLYHWTHLEMKRYFGINEPLSAKNAKKLYDKMNEMLAKPEFSARGFIERSNVVQICTTDDPVDSLSCHQQIAENPIKNCTVRPTFRPDRALLIEKPDFPEYMSLLGKAAGIAIKSLDDVIAALKARIDYFEKHGCVLSDHDFGRLPACVASPKEAEETWEKRMSGIIPSVAEQDGYKAYMLLRLAACFKEKDWTIQLHCGAMRNNNTRMFNKIGKDTGYDTMSDYETANSLSRLLDALDYQNALPRTVLYTLNPKDFYTMIALCGCFTEAGTRGKTQFGSAWWFIDHKDGMERQLRESASLNLLSVFVGMLTDSRSFTSYPRHEYFRRIMCNFVGNLVDSGEYPDDEELLEKIVSGICYDNARDYFKFNR